MIIPLEYKMDFKIEIESYVNLIDSGKININSLIDDIEPIQNAKEVYSAFEKKEETNFNSF